MAATIRYRDHAGNDRSRNEVVMFADVRVFIMGVEVSNFLTGDISVNRAARGTDGTCSFALDNNYDRFIIRPENLGGRTAPYDYEQGQNPSTLLPDIGIVKPSLPPAPQISGSHSTAPAYGQFWDDPRLLDPSKFSWVISDSNETRGTFEYDETPKKELFEYKYSQILEFSGINNSNSASVNNFSSAGSTPADTKFVNTNPSLGSVIQPRFDLTVGACVLHLHDEVRVFVADPNSDPLTDADRRWMPLFSGVISTLSVSRNRMNGESSISVSCADARYLMRKMRIAANYQPRDHTKAVIKFDNEVGMFQDVMPLASMTDGKVKFENVLSELSYREITRAILCGDSKIDIQNGDKANPYGTSVPEFNLANGMNPYRDKVVSQKHEYSTSLNMRGIGSFSLGYEVNFDSTMSDTQKTGVLEEWNDLVLFGIKRDWYTDAEVDVIGQGTRPINYDQRSVDVDAVTNRPTGQDVSVSSPSPFSVMNGFVHYLLPSKGTGALGIRNAIERALLQTSSDLNWLNRLDVLVQISETIDYQFSVTPMGDIVFEFTMYDFQPQIFGKYMACYSVSDSIKTDEHNDEGDGNVVTGLVVRGGFQDADAGSNSSVEKVPEDQAYSVIIKSDYMAAKYGIVIEEYSIPWLDKVWTLESTDASGNSVDNNALKRNSCISFGILEFFRRISAMSSMGFSGCYNPFWLPNRPCLNILQRRLGLTNTCSITIPIEGAPSSTVETYFVRKANHHNKFVTLNGAENTPFGYASESRLELFSTAGLDNIRTLFGIEIVDPSKSLVTDIATGSAGTLSPLFSPSARTDFPTNVDLNNYSMSPGIVKSRARFDRLKQTNPRLADLIARAATSHGMDPYVLYRIMEFESGGGDHIDPAGHYDKKNPSRGAQGVIQFMPLTLRGLRKDPETFMKDYPTVESQMDLVNKYLDKVVAAYGPLDSPYKAYMATFNPASMHDNMFAPFTESKNAWTRNNSDAITRQNGGIKNPAELMLRLGINYFQPTGGSYSDVRPSKNGPVTVELNYSPIRQPTPPPNRQQLTGNHQIAPGLNISHPTA